VKFKAQGVAVVIANCMVSEAISASRDCRGKESSPLAGEDRGEGEKKLIHRKVRRDVLLSKNI